MHQILMVDDELWLLLARKSFLGGKGCQVGTACPRHEFVETVWGKGSSGGAGSWCSPSVPQEASSAYTGSRQERDTSRARSNANPFSSHASTPDPP